MFKLVFFVATLAVAMADIVYPGNNRGPQFRILRQEQDVDPSGTYKWAYETENGIAAQESGQLQQSRYSNQPGTFAQGSYSYTSPEGIPIAVSYVADDNGFQPQVSGLSTPPPIPPAFVRSLTYNRRSVAGRI